MVDDGRQLVNQALMITWRSSADLLSVTESDIVVIETGEDDEKMILQCSERYETSERGSIPSPSV